ncbi:general vesicular transport factor p115 isoform X1 [Syngnathus typhle]|uniref:general vesicular transport factor p115 isoform X1 n=1 Tax=Syngnathus typhle TaxID=161592 RepID=UPI002A6B2149|nr:general vesicular transport factor p115 isoform X1 [Syngnathus typhle]
MNFFRGVMGGQAAGPQPTGAETIQKLCDRVASSTLLEDRRDAVRALKSLSKKYRMEVGTQAMDHLINILQTDRSDSEILGYALDTMYNIICNDEEEEQDESEDETAQKQADDLGAKFTEAFIQDPEHITLLLTMLEEFDFHVRWPAVKLLTALLRNQCVQLQSIILVSPMGVSRLMDLLADSREVIRNDGLLLLQQLTKSNAAIQKIVAFENAFERLLDIITEEGSSDGGIVVEDCLLLLRNLLKNNSSNQNFFKEGSFIQRMRPWFEVGDDNSGWSAQKVTNLHLMLQLVRVMVSPVNSPGATASCQRSMYQCGLLQQLCTILMATGVPADILTETINTVSEVIRGSQINQDYFASVNAPSNPPRPAIVVLLMSMVNERQPFVLRCAVLYCFQCFLYKNQKGQGEIVATLLPSTIDANSISAGQLLCGGLFSADSLSNWCASVALAHALQDNLTQKEQLLRVQLATSLGKPPVSLLQQCTNILSQGDKISRRGSKVQTRVGLLMLLCTWINNCPIAVTHFLHNQENVPFLTAQISENLGEDERLVQGLCALLLGICIYYNDNSLENYTKEKLKQLIEKRIGKENFVEKLGFVTKHELYSRAAQKPQPVFPSPDQMLFDHEFTKLVKELEGVITKAVHKSSEDEKKEEEVKKTLEQHDNIVTQYKELIREQDSKIQELKEQVSSLTTQTEQMQATMTQQQSQIQQHKDQYNILKLKLGKENSSQASITLGDGAHVNGVQTEEATQLREEMEELRSQHALLQTQLGEKDAIINSLRSERSQPTDGDTAGSDNAELLKELELLRSQVQSQAAEIGQMKSDNADLLRRAETEVRTGLKNKKIFGVIFNQVEPLQSSSDFPSDATKTAELESRLAAQTSEVERLKEEVQGLTGGREQLEQQTASATSSAAILKAEMAKLEAELLESKKEQDDLLMLLADQDQKIQSLRKRLKDLGETVDDEDELDTRDQTDEDDEDED